MLAPSSSKEKPQQGVVLAVGEGKRTKSGELLPLGITVGMRVLFSKYSGTEVKLDDVDMLVLREDDIMAVFEG